VFEEAMALGVDLRRIQCVRRNRNAGHRRMSGCARSHNDSSWRGLLELRTKSSVLFGQLPVALLDRIHPLDQVVELVGISRQSLSYHSDGRYSHAQCIFPHRLPPRDDSPQGTKSSLTASGNTVNVSFTMFKLLRMRRRFRNSACKAILIQ
jgi:hypothetical protein